MDAKLAADGILKAIDERITDGADKAETIKQGIDEAQKDGASREAIQAALTELKTKYPQCKAQIEKLILAQNKAYICDIAGYLARKQNTEKDSGYICNVFKQCNNRAREIKPITIRTGTLSYIGAMTHRGKTTALISIALDAIKQAITAQKESKSLHKVVFVTSEETPEQIFDRMIAAILYTEYKDTKDGRGNNILTSDIDEIGNRIDYYLKSYSGGQLIADTPKTLQEAIYSSYEKLAGYLNSGIFALIDHTQQTTFDALEILLNTIDNGSIVLTDYIQHLKRIEADSYISNRQVIIQNISQRLGDIAGQKDLIIIAGAQFRREGKTTKTEADKYKPDILDLTLFRESGDIEQDAHLVIGIGQQVLKPNKDSEETTVHRFYEVLKQRGHAEDSNKYAINDNAIYSLYSCKTYTDNDNKERLECFPETKGKQTGKTASSTDDDYYEVKYE